MAKVNPSLFLRQVKQEVGKVTWPSRKEAIAGTVMVLVLSSLAATFFFVVDLFFAWIMKIVLGFGG